jgi:hypothetical protein
MLDKYTQRLMQRLASEVDHLQKRTRTTPVKLPIHTYHVSVHSGPTFVDDFWHKITKLGTLQNSSNAPQTVSTKKLEYMHPKQQPTCTTVDTMYKQMRQLRAWSKTKNVVKKTK